MVIVITGSTKGIGKAITDRFASDGTTLFLTARTLRDLETQKTELSQKYPEITVHLFPADFAKKEEVLAFGDFILSKNSHLDILVNNAGIFLPGALMDESEGKLETLMSVNLYSAYHLTRKLMPLLKKSQKAHLFNMCSIASKTAYTNGGSYSITKYALLGFTHNLREELKPKGIKVTAVLPGATWSDSWAGVNLPHDRLMEASDIAEAIYSAYHLSPAAVVEEIILRPLLGDL